MRNKPIKTFIDETIKDFIDEIDVRNLKDLQLKTQAPQVGKQKYRTSVENEKINVLDNKFLPNHKYDYVVDLDGEIHIGDGHYKLASKATAIKAAGEIIIDSNGKVVYLNNESGHYEPSKEDLLAIADKFKELKIASPEIQIDIKH